MTDQRSIIRRRRLFVAGAVLFVAALVAGISLYVRNYGEPRRFAVVQENRLYRSAQPTTHQIDHLIENEGLRSVLIVRDGNSRRVPNEYEHAQSRGLKVLHIPVISREPIPDHQVQAFFDFVDDPANQPVLVHCSAGRHRTGYLCGLYRIERQGWTVEQAVEEMLTFEPDMDPQRPELQQLKSYKPSASAGHGADPSQ